MKIHYNSPVILTYTLTAAAVLVANVATGNWMTSAFFTTYPSDSLFNPFTYFKLFSHVVGHANWGHLAGNFSIILLIGPLLEEKYGSLLMFVMIIATALTTSLLNTFFFHTGLLGASGVVFMLIILSSFANIRAG